MEDGAVTIEGLQEQIAGLQEQLKATVDTAEINTNMIADLTAERDSLKEELDALKKAHETQAQELQDTKKLNFTLGRTIGAQQTLEETAENAMQEMFKNIR